MKYPIRKCPAKKVILTSSFLQFGTTSAFILVNFKLIGHKDEVTLTFNFFLKLTSVNQIPDLEHQTLVPNRAKLAIMSAMDIDSGSLKPQPPATEISESSTPTSTSTPSSATKTASTATATATNNDDPDPIVASYDVYTNAPLADNRKLLILQYPNKQGPIRGTYPQFSEVRLKTKSGFVEVDVPMAHGHVDYDRDKGMKWGSALARSTAAKNGGTHGLAGGFGVGVPTRSAAGGAGRGAGGAAGGRQNDWQHEISMMDWSEAVRQDKVIRTQTLGGQFAIEKETNCRWMVGVFKGGKLSNTLCYIGGVSVLKFDHV